MGYSYPCIANSDESISLPPAHNSCMSEMHEADAMTTYVNEFELSEVGIDPGRAGISR